eukprot:scaffold9008_cov56-Cyclotella_meneghiniana.AAC.1
MPPQDKATMIGIGDVGYVFNKRFDEGWFVGEVVEIRPNAAQGKTRRCRYNDGDEEDLSLAELRALAKLDNSPTSTSPKTKFNAAASASAKVTELNAEFARSAKNRAARVTPPKRKAMAAKAAKSNASVRAAKVWKAKKIRAINNRIRAAKNRAKDATVSNVAFTPSLHMKKAVHDVTPSPNKRGISKAIEDEVIEGVDCSPSKKKRSAFMKAVQSIKSPVGAKSDDPPSANKVRDISDDPPSTKEDPVMIARVFKRLGTKFQVNLNGKIELDGKKVYHIGTYDKNKTAIAVCNLVNELLPTRQDWTKELLRMTVEKKLSVGAFSIERTQNGTPRYIFKMAKKDRI